MAPRDILSEIVEHKKVEVKAARETLPENHLREEALLPRGNRPFYSRLARPGSSGVNIIAEIKRASPSKGILNADLDPAIMARAYEEGGATALSVLTDRKYFMGSPEDLTVARKATVLPVLRKDFLITSYQLYESAVLGADAVLLIVRILSERQLNDYLALAEELNLDALVEIHSMDDLQIAARTGAQLIGINNRNLRSFETNIETAISMVSALRPSQVPVAASGIRKPADIERNLESGIHNFLIGESLVRAPDPGAFIESLLSAAEH